MSRLAKISLVTLARRIVLILGMIILLAIGLDMVWQLSQPRGWAMPFQWVELSKMDIWPLAIFAALCVILPFVYAFLCKVQSRLERGIVGKGKDGENICLAPEAVERVIVRQVRGKVPEVARIRHCEALQGSKGARVRLAIAVSEGESVPVVRSNVHRVVQQALIQLVGFADGSEVGIKVIELSRGSAPGPSGKKKRLAKPPRGKKTVQ